jgi:hypothetical protein
MLNAAAYSTCGYMNIHTRTYMNNYIRHFQVRGFTVKQDRSRRGHHYGET